MKSSSLQLNKNLSWNYWWKLFFFWKFRNCFFSLTSMITILPYYPTYMAHRHLKASKNLHYKRPIISCLFKRASLPLLDHLGPAVALPGREHPGIWYGTNVGHMSSWGLYLDLQNTKKSHYMSTWPCICYKAMVNLISHKRRGPYIMRLFRVLKSK